MDVRTLRWFQQVADGVTVTEIAETEPTTQPGVSRALARLEKDVGTPLLHRVGRTLRPTRAGTVFKRHVDAAIHQLDDGLAAVQQVLDPHSGSISMAFQPSLGTWLVPDLISRFQSDHPGVTFDLLRKEDELTSAVGPQTDVDLDLSTRRPSGAEAHWHSLVTEPLVLAVPADHALADQDRIALRSCAGEPFIAIRPTSALREVSEDLLRRAEVTPVAAFVCDDLPTMSAFVAAGLGVAIMPRPRAGGDRRVRHLEIDDPLAWREVGISWSRARRLLPSARLFVDHVLRRRDTRALPSTP